MLTIEQALEELNESDVADSFGDLHGSIDCLETVETIDDFTANIDSAISEALALIEGLEALRARFGTTARSEPVNPRCTQRP